MIPVDFNEGQNVYDDIQAEISDLDIAILGILHYTIKSPLILLQLIMLVLVLVVNRILVKLIH